MLSEQLATFVTCPHIRPAYVIQTRPIEDAVQIFEEMENGTIQGRMVIDMDYHNKNK